ncbi:sensor histidine kinase [Polluticaenibacter yanchengensis]|uniref:histidine kinase n=1 Tax=Polluticaenibacter yanchengensis TaxID=3014562 RepID=A0ABT4UGG7_9BACT|nr:HAMP domain-containing sensor histidine kinase [Chitinophagaceae bacterium LY-5]
MPRKSIKTHFWWLLIASWVYTLTFVFNNYWSKYASYDSVTESFQKALDNKIKNFNEWSSSPENLKPFFQNNYTLNDLQKLRDAPFDILIYKEFNENNSALENNIDNKEEVLPVFWSTNEVFFDESYLNNLNNLLTYGNGSYHVLKKNYTIDNNSYIVIGLIKIQTKYFIENENLTTHFPGFEGLKNKLEIVDTPTNYVVYDEARQPLFYFKPLVAEPIYVFNILSFIIEIITTLLIFVFITRVFNSLLNTGKLWIGIIALIIGFATISICVLYLNFPINLSKIQSYITENTKISFNIPKVIYVSFLATWIGVILTKKNIYISNRLKAYNKRQKTIISIVIGLLIVALLFFNARQSIKILDSFYNLDIHILTNNASKTVTSFIALFLISTNQILITFALRNIILRIRILNHIRFNFLISVLLLCGLTILVVYSNNTYYYFYIAIWFIISLMLFKNPFSPILAINSFNVLIIVFISASISLFINIIKNQKLSTDVKNTAEVVLQKNDSSIDYSVQISLAGFRKVNWNKIINRGKQNDQTFEHLKDSLRSVHLTGFLKKFDTEIHLFDRNNNNIYVDDNLSFNNINTLYNNQEPSPNFSGLVYYSESFNNYGYIYKQNLYEAQDQNSELSFNGTLFLIIHYKSGSDKVGIPEIFNQISNIKNELPEVYSYAWYKNDTINDIFGYYDFPLTVSKDYFKNGNFHENRNFNSYEYWHKINNNQTLAFSINRNFVIDLISGFAYIFSAFIIIFILLILLANTSNFKHKNIRLKNLSLTIKQKINTSILVILLIVFITIAYFTISFFINQYHNDIVKKLVSKIEELDTNIDREFIRIKENGNEGNLNYSIQKTISNFCKVNDLDANLYDVNGYIQLSTQNVLFAKEIMGPMINPTTWAKFKNNERYRVIADESIGNLKYSSIYQPLKSPDNEIKGYLQLSFYASENIINKEIYGFLIILINVITFIFIISGSIAFWISENITKNFRLIALKMRMVKLGNNNELIEWPNNDEIGILVKQYNRMIVQLENSVKQLAKTERDLAWKEMAKQVAHEIKNPLTPIKLNLQYLNKSITENKPNINELTQKVTTSIIEQIDHLSNIATEFSQFANIGTVFAEEFSLLDVLRQLETLNQVNNGTVNIIEPSKNPILFADKTQINRLFTNLIKNAFEAAQDNQKITITITIVNNEASDTVDIEVKDNGKGVPQELLNKIFSPNFTTKNSGTGLGLAICKAIVESINGNITFTSKLNVGTTFYISLPVKKFEPML